MYDFKAEMLGLVRRFDAARQACFPPVFKQKPMIELRGRAAWIKAMQQDYDAAKDQMRAILKEDRTYAWGLNQLVEWSYATHDFKAYHDVANEIVRVRPQSAAALACRGEARVRMEEREEGLTDSRNASRKDPCNTLAAFLLFDEYMNDDNDAAAEAALLSLQQNIVGDFVTPAGAKFRSNANQTIAWKSSNISAHRRSRSRNRWTWPCAPSSTRAGRNRPSKSSSTRCRNRIGTHIWR